MINLQQYKSAQFLSPLATLFSLMTSKAEEPDQMANKEDDSAFHLARDVNKKAQNDVEAT